MTAPAPTPATLDAAVEAAADALCASTFAFTAVQMQPDGAYGVDLPAERLARTVLHAAAPILAAGHADQLAQAHAAGTAEGAAAERERIAASLRTAADLHRIAAEDCLKATLAGGGAEFIAMWDRQHVNSLAAATALEEHAAAIARAGTSEANRG